MSTTRSRPRDRRERRVHVGGLGVVDVAHAVVRRRPSSSRCGSPVNAAQRRADGVDASRRRRARARAAASAFGEVERRRARAGPRRAASSCRRRRRADGREPCPRARAPAAAPRPRRTATRAAGCAGRQPRDHRIVGVEHQQVVGLLARRTRAPWPRRSRRTCGASRGGRAPRFRSAAARGRNALGVERELERRHLGHHDVDVVVNGIEQRAADVAGRDRAQTRRLEHRGRERRDGRLAVRPGDGDERGAAVPRAARPRGRSPIARAPRAARRRRSAAWRSGTPGLGTTRSAPRRRSSSSACVRRRRLDDLARPGRGARRHRVVGRRRSTDGPRPRSTSSPRARAVAHHGARR